MAEGDPAVHQAPASEPGPKSTVSAAKLPSCCKCLLHLNQALQAARYMAVAGAASVAHSLRADMPCCCHCPHYPSAVD